MSRIALILGSNGRFGRAIAAALEADGWTLRLFDRNTDRLEDAARGVSVIVNGWNMLYSRWKDELLQMQPDIHRAALANDATVLIPGNVYVFGADTPAPWNSASAHNATNGLGRIRIAMEQAYRDAGVRTIVLRAGDFLDTSASGNWFDLIMAKGLNKGRFTYPGNPNIPHAFAFLPDFARAAAQLCNKRDTLARFEDIPFPGYTLSGTDIARHLSKARGHAVHVRPMTWWVMRLLQPFWGEVKHFFEMRYLWDTPHSLSSARFDALLPDFEATPAQEALRQASAHVPLPAARVSAGQSLTA